MILQQLLKLLETDDDHDDYDGSVYEREKKVSQLILKALHKCGLEVSEHDGYGGTEGHDRIHYDVLYSEDDFEAMVTLEEAELANLAQLHESGLFEGKCNVTGTSDGRIRLTFKVNSHLRSGEAKFDGE